ncbi:MAG: hypothetical protein GY750_00325 [Lentisphaerae bacterium]|nr:hypothetical protein [Lentisphaerota bacterium]MCP4099865.1 hypothetical protein [Lentisphaerota bacterium]
MEAEPGPTSQAKENTPDKWQHDHFSGVEELYEDYPWQTSFHQAITIMIW